MGRDEIENNVLSAMARNWGIPNMNVVDYMGPTTLVAYGIDEETTDFAASLTLRYSDTPRNVLVKILFNRDGIDTTLIRILDDEEYERIKRELKPVN